MSGPQEMTRAQDPARQMAQLRRQVARQAKAILVLLAISVGLLLCCLILGAAAWHNTALAADTTPQAEATAREPIVPDKPPAGEKRPARREITALQAMSPQATPTPAPAQSPTPSPAAPAGTRTLRATAYCPCVQCCGIWSAAHPSRAGTGYVQTTASGTTPTAGRTIAVDTDVIPFGSLVIIDGRTYVAEDRGGAIQGDEIDIYFDSHQEALAWGVRYVQAQIVEAAE